MGGRNLDYAIEIEGLTKTYPNGFTAVSNLSLKVPKGVFGFLGPNGAGKTTTIEILVGAVKPTSGTAYILGYDILGESMETRKRIGYLPENPGFYSDMSGFRFLRYMGELDGLSRSRASERAKELLEWIGLDSWADSPIARYSMGMRQRLGMAQSLLSDPPVVFLDEPTANLDPLGRADLLERVQSLGKQGKTVFVSTHILSEIEQMADHIAIINNGELIEHGSLQELTGRIEGYKIDVSDPETFMNELESSGLSAEVQLDHGQVLVKTRDHERLLSEVPWIVTKHKMHLRAFGPIRRDLQMVYMRALKNARKGVKI